MCKPSTVFIQEDVDHVIVATTSTTRVALQVELKCTEDRLSQTFISELQKIATNNEQQKNHRSEMAAMIKKFNDLTTDSQAKGEILNDLLVRNSNGQRCK